MNIEEVERPLDDAGEAVIEYFCREEGCGWTGSSRKSAGKHVKRVHPAGGGCHVFSIETEEEAAARLQRKRAADAAKSRRYRANKKAKRQVSGSQRRSRALGFEAHHRGCTPAAGRGRRVWQYRAGRVGLVACSRRFCLCSYSPTAW